jgi:hypothetical protein
MARPRTPTKILKDKGAFKKNPQRAIERAAEPEVVGRLGKPPAHMLIKAPASGFQAAERQRKIWYQIARDCDWLDRADRMVVDALCRATDAMNIASTANSKNLPSLLAAQRGLMSDLGIPQAQRSKVRGAGDPGDGPGSVRMSLEIDL